LDEHLTDDESIGYDEHPKPMVIDTPALIAPLVDEAPQMAILIKDKDADRLIRELAERTGESITDAVKRAVAERLERVPRSKREITARKQRIDALLVKLDAMPTVDHRTPEEIIGYSNRGVFD